MGTEQLPFLRRRHPGENYGDLFGETLTSIEFLLEKQTSSFARKLC